MTYANVFHKKTEAMSYPKKIGKGKRISVAKAALVFWYEVLLPWNKSTNVSEPVLYWGDFYHMEAISNIADTDSASYFLPAQISSRLATSPYWDKIFVEGVHKGFRGGARNANYYTPSEKGRLYYRDKLDGLNLSKHIHENLRSYYT